MGVPKSETEFVFKVNLKSSKRVSRTVALRGDQTLDDLHEAIFAAFDRFDVHLYSFYFPKAPTRRGTAGPKPKEYTAPQMFDELDTLDDEGRFDAATTKLDDLRLRPGQKFEYLFDFGDSWWHEGIVEAVNPSVPRTRYPQIRESRGASPPQYEAVDE
ncbi:MAG: plasmid pRiA4b ORF-3 family protein [Candidatus Eisenbacteria bacterium]|nr:plasmid pRiA4b ORF-3 family protein [Candidatus Eisenbacteria bacterium]